MLISDSHMPLIRKSSKASELTAQSLVTTTEGGLGVVKRKERVLNEDPSSIGGLQSLCCKVRALHLGGNDQVNHLL